MGGIHLSELRILTGIAILIGAVIALTSYFIFHVPTVYCIVLGLSTCVMFYFVVLWSSYVFIYH